MSKEREAFEKWAAGQFLPLQKTELSGEPSYVASHTQSSWHAWQGLSAVLREEIASHELARDALARENMILIDNLTTLKALLEQAREGLDVISHSPYVTTATDCYEVAETALAAINAATGEK